MHTDILYASRNPAALPWLQSSSQIFTLCIISGTTNARAWKRNDIRTHFPATLAQGETANAWTTPHVHTYGVHRLAQILDLLSHLPSMFSQAISPH